MPHKTRVHSPLAIELLFKRKYNQRLVDVIAQQPHPSLTPGPELRRDVIDHRNTALLHLPGHAPVKRRRINHDGEIRFSLVGFEDQLAEESIDFRQMAKDFGDADYSEVFGVDHSLAARSSHLLSAHAEELKRWCWCGASRPRLCGGAKLGRAPLSRPPQSFNKLCPIHFPGRFAGRDQNAHRSIVPGVSLRSNRHPGREKNHAVAVSSCPMPVGGVTEGLHLPLNIPDSIRASLPPCRKPYPPTEPSGARFRTSLFSAQMHSNSVATIRYIKLEVGTKKTGASIC